MKNVVLILGPVTKEDAMKSEKYLLYEALKRVQRELCHYLWKTEVFNLIYMEVYFIKKIRVNTSI